MISNFRPINEIDRRPTAFLKRKLFSLTRGEHALIDQLVISSREVFRFGDFQVVGVVELSNEKFYKFAKIRY